MQTVRVLFLLYQFRFFLFLFLLWLPLLGLHNSKFKIMLNQSGKGGYSCLVPDLRGSTFSFLPLRKMLAMGLSYMAFTMLDSFYAHFLESFFYHKSLLNFIKSLFCIYWDNHLIFILQFINIVYHNLFVDIRKYLYPWDKSHLIMMYKTFNVLLD